MKSLDYGQRDVRLEQGNRDVAQRRLDVRLAERAAALQPIEDVIQTAGQALEHGRPISCDLLRANQWGRGGERRSRMIGMLEGGFGQVKAGRRFGAFWQLRGASPALACNSAMDELAFHKMHGLGNDFVILDRRAASCRSAPRRPGDADRRLGVGCDQLLSLGTSERAQRVHAVYNPDGLSPVPAAPNARCVARLMMEERRFGARRR